MSSNNFLVELKSVRWKIAFLINSYWESFLIASVIVCFTYEFFRLWLALSLSLLPHHRALLTLQMNYSIGSRRRYETIKLSGKKSSIWREEKVIERWSALTRAHCARFRTNNIISQTSLGIVCTEYKDHRPPFLGPFHHPINGCYPIIFLVQCDLCAITLAHNYGHAHVRVALTFGYGIMLQRIREGMNKIQDEHTHTNAFESKDIQHTRTCMVKFTWRRRLHKTKWKRDEANERRWRNGWKERQSVGSTKMGMNIV